jgi:lipopolysaccharide export system permease protein
MWVLEGVQHGRKTEDGLRTENLDSLSFDLGRTPQDLERVELDTDEMPTSQLRQELRTAERGVPPDPGQAAEIRNEIARRWAVPWAVLGFAMVGVILGVRPQRTTRSLALGISLAVILVYYLIMHTMSILADQGRLPAMLCAWLPNGGLYAIGLVGLVSGDR